MGNRRITGKLGEELAATHLKELGYEILDRNYRCSLGEIDIVARDNKDLVFIEVKTRTSTSFGFPQESVTRSKQLRIRKIALYYLAENQPPYYSYRFDVVSILLHGDKVEVLEVIRNAF